MRCRSYLQIADFSGSFLWVGDLASYLTLREIQKSTGSALVVSET